MVREPVSQGPGERAERDASGWTDGSVVTTKTCRRFAVTRKRKLGRGMGSAARRGPRRSRFRAGRFGGRVTSAFFCRSRSSQQHGVGQLIGARGEHQVPFGVGHSPVSPYFQSLGGEGLQGDGGQPVVVGDAGTGRAGRNRKQRSMGVHKAHLFWRPVSLFNAATPMWRTFPRKRSIWLRGWRANGTLGGGGSDPVMTNLRGASLPRQ